MFDIGFAEMVIIGVVALIVVGPKDLPKMFRMAGEFVGKARGMARQFQSAMNDAAKSAELDDVKKAMDGVKAVSDPVGTARKSAQNYAKSIMGDADPGGDAGADAGAEPGQTAKPEVPHFEDEAEPDWMPPKTEHKRAVPPAEARAAEAAAAAAADKET